MTVTIENGQDIIDILSDGFVTCLKVRKPVAVDWYDCAGSAGKYFSFTPDFEPVAKHFNAVLLGGNDAEIIESISDFLRLFNSGIYSISIDRNKRTDYELHFDYRQSDNPVGFEYWYYNTSGENLMFTQLYSTINQEKVKEYEKLILQGQRPKALVFQAFFIDQGTYNDGSEWMRSVDSPMFILDGHHKLLAYKNLNIEPELVIITKESTGKEEFAKSKKNLFFEFENFLRDSSKIHIISHAPMMLTDTSVSTKNYNRLFDKYLSDTPRVEVKILELFEKASESTDESSLNWLQDRLDILRARNFEEKNSWLNYHVLNEEHPHGLWDGMEVKSPSDFEIWIKKVFGTDDRGK